MKKVIIRVLGGEIIGYGHFYRCVSLAQALDLKQKDSKIIFLVNKELISLIDITKFDYEVSNSLNEDYEVIKNLRPDLFIFDSYLGNDNYLKKIKSVSKLMLIDDNNDIYDSKLADIIYNGNIHAKNLGYKKIAGQLQLLGSEYLIMKQEYWQNEIKPDRKKEGILITTGGSDRYGVSFRILENILLCRRKVSIIIGPGYTERLINQIKSIKKGNIELIYKPKSLKDYISNSEIVICAGGSTVYEVLSQKKLPIIFSIADNQDQICDYLNNSGLVYLGKYPDMDYKKLKNAVIKFDESRYRDLKGSFQKLDGKGAIRVAKAIFEIV